MNTQNRRKPTNLSLDNALLSEARALDVNLSRAAEQGIRAAVQRAQMLLWQQENAAALASSNAHVDQNGLPLSRVRQF
ncbi:type II toxin-antitoxin system CcdA family antitoxin [Tateyamaria sp. ANG-S1]|uniref:type II toxin-antitoxin system CcdA family antitoxin n=1 Tax=Tateyamaria sp. ANG-S1 TaxID=1577905 RepID=UPI00057DE6DB|nr:type II toxin-antitoxin system CcdA family antitoxin [Tateyamaria sp. ANG-S1]KIC47688.1 post-segregation antitoxin CcdA [Tateyamaria sp. ANG-S1]